MKHFGKNVFADAKPADGSRRGRESVHVAARLRIAGAASAMKVGIRNVSAGGLMAELPRAIAPDAAIEVELAGIGWVAGRVAWQTAGRVGVAFDREIDPALLVAEEADGE